MNEENDGAEECDAPRGRLTGIAYGIPGGVDGAGDVARESWIGLRGPAPRPRLPRPHRPPGGLPFLHVTGVPGGYAAGDTAAAYAEPGHQVLPAPHRGRGEGKEGGRMT
ncbi:hypothetical protein GCM10010446_35130 [Streptomyces enissocaesilis]|uniref:Uncharacterized protein n=1 Tax=Streptomyces enissocaesilis TaxID=332589 RepID=A0ABP6JTE1_9ACTN